VSHGKTGGLARGSEHDDERWKGEATIQGFASNVGVRLMRTSRRSGVIEPMVCGVRIGRDSDSGAGVTSLVAGGSVWPGDGALARRSVAPVGECDCQEGEVTGILTLTHVAARAASRRFWGFTREPVRHATARCDES
jgi:hypothetical protein